MEKELERPETSVDATRRDTRTAMVIGGTVKLDANRSNTKLTRLNPNMLIDGTK